MSEERNHSVMSVVVMQEEYKNGEGCAPNSHKQGNPVSECPPNLDNWESLNNW